MLPPGASSSMLASVVSGLDRLRRQDDRYCASARAQEGFIISEGVFQIRLCINANVSPSESRARFS